MKVVVKVVKEGSEGSEGTYRPRRPTNRQSPNSSPDSSYIAVQSILPCVPPTTPMPCLSLLFGDQNSAAQQLFSGGKSSIEYPDVIIAYINGCIVKNSHGYRPKIKDAGEENFATCRTACMHFTGQMEGGFYMHL